MVLYTDDDDLFFLTPTSLANHEDCRVRQKRVSLTERGGTLEVGSFDPNSRKTISRRNRDVGLVVRDLGMTTEIINRIIDNS